MKTLIERFAMWLLRMIGTEVFIVPVVMTKYTEEIKMLCEIENELAVGQPNYTGYFKYRRVFTQMKNRHSEINSRDLSKAIVALVEKL